MSPCAIKHKSVIIYSCDLLITIKDFVLKNKMRDGGSGIFKGGYMEKRRKEYAEFRFYEKPPKEPVLALMGENWIRYYGEGIDYLHFHNLMEIGYCVWGKGQVVMNKQIYDYSDGTFTMIPHNILHTTNSAHLCFWEYLFFDVEEIIKDYYKDNPSKAENVLHSVMQDGLVYHENDYPHLAKIIRLIFELFKKKETYYKETINGLLFSLVMQLAGKNEGVSVYHTATETGGSKIAPALHYIGTRYKEDIRVSDLADYCHLSETHFRRIFLEDMSMTPVEYINLTRVQAACDLMRKGNGHMEEIAVKVGYQTMSTFNRNFRKIIGTSPYQWKKNTDQNMEIIENYHISAKKGW